jgi:hypothetical protein
MDNNDEEFVILNEMREILDIEMSQEFKKAKEIVRKAAEDLKELNITYILKICESEISHDADALDVQVFCNTSEMNVNVATMFIEYEMKRLIQHADKFGL